MCRTGLSLGAYLLGPLKELFSYRVLILVCILTSAVTLFLLRYIKLEVHQSDVEDLEQNGSNSFSLVVKKIINTVLR